MPLFLKLAAFEKESRAAAQSPSSRPCLFARDISLATSAASWAIDTEESLSLGGGGWSWSGRSCLLVGMLAEAGGGREREKRRRRSDDDEELSSSRRDRECELLLVEAAALRFLLSAWICSVFGVSLGAFLGGNAEAAARQESILSVQCCFSICLFNRKC